MKRAAMIALAFTCFLWACKEDQSIIGPPNEDLSLKANLVGTWVLDGGYRITYSADGTFIDSAFVRSQIDTNQYSLLEVRQGRYTIENGILDHINIHFAYLDSAAFQGGLSSIPIPQEIQIIGNRLIRKSVDVLTSVQGFGYQLWGKWTMIKWAYHRADGPPRIVYEGRQKYTFTFHRDSSYFQYGWEYLDGNPWPNPSWRSEFTYTPPLLNAQGPGYYNIRVEFKYGKMYWYYDYSNAELLKLN